MLTNILASIVVTVVTNVTEQYPQRMESLPGTIGPNGETYAVHNFRWVPVEHPTNKTVITDCKEITVLRFEWLGEPREVVSEKLIWSTNREMVLEKTWK